MSDHTYLRFEKKDRIGIVTLVGPKAVTVLGTEMLRALGEFFRSVRSDPAVKVLILTGEGTAFAAGADIKEMQVLSPAAAREFSRLGNAVFGSIETHPIPVIAAVNGAALGGGLELALCADFAFAANTARFGLPEVTLGLIPGFGGCRRLSARIGMPRAKELIYTGRVIAAAEALSLGIVNKITEPDALLAAAVGAAREIVSASGNAVREVKTLLTACSTRNAEEVGALEMKQFGSVFTHPDAAAGLSAFINKTKPEWKDGQ